MLGTVVTAAVLSIRLRMKRLMQSCLNRFGYRLEKLRHPLPDNAITLSDFALQALNCQRGGAVRFVQIGANDGIHQDPCREWLLRYPWRGVLVEPQPKLAAKLRALYQDNGGIAIEQVVVSDKPGEFAFYYLEDRPGIPSWATAVASLDYALLASYRNNIPGFDEALSVMKVPSLTLAEILDRHRMPDLDFLQIDAEGADARILASVNFKSIKPAVICYEETNLPYDERAETRARLKENGYFFAFWLGQVLACQPSVLPLKITPRRYP